MRTCKLATHKEGHNYILYCFYAQTLEPPAMNKRMTDQQTLREKMEKKMEQLCTSTAPLTPILSIPLEADN